MMYIPVSYTHLDVYKRQAIAGESGVPGSLIGSIDMFDNYTFVDVPDDCADEVLKAMKNVRIRGKNVRMEKANR